MTFRIGSALASLQYLDNHELHCFDFCIECKPNDRTCHILSSSENNDYLRRNKHFSKWCDRCVSKVFQYINLV